jgi:hypothetical protein
MGFAIAWSREYNWVEDGERADHTMDLKDMIVTVVYQSPDGLVPLQILEAVARQFGTQTTTKQVLKIVEKNPKLFIEINGRIRSPSNYSLK